MLQDIDITAICTKKNISLPLDTSRFGRFSIHYLHPAYLISLLSLSSYSIFHSYFSLFFLLSLLCALLSSLFFSFSPSLLNSSQNYTTTVIHLWYWSPSPFPSLLLPLADQASSSSTPSFGHSSSWGTTHPRTNYALVHHRWTDLISDHHSVSGSPDPLTDIQVDYALTFDIKYQDS